MSLTSTIQPSEHKVLAITPKSSRNPGRNLRHIDVPMLYFAQFEKPLTLKELRRYIWRHEVGLEHLRHELHVRPWKMKDGMYYVDKAHLEARRKSEEESERFWHRVKKFRGVFGLIPFLKLVAVGNTLAINRVGDNSDIDLFIVAKSGRVWTTRMVLLLWLTLLRARVRSEKKYMKFSPEFFVDETSLNLSQFALASDYYLNFWVADLVPVWGEQYFTRFWRANDWLKSSLPIAFRSPNLRTDFKKSHSSPIAVILEKSLGGGLGDKIEEWARRRQETIIQKSLNRIGVNPSVITEHNVIKLHFNDRRGEIRDRLDESLV